MITAINFKENLKQFTKKAVSISLSALLTISTLGTSQVYAENKVDMLGGGSTGGDQSAAYGFSENSNVGYRIYCLDEDGNTVKDENGKEKVVDILFREILYRTDDEVALTTQKGVDVKRIRINVASTMNMPKIIWTDSDGNWHSNYEELRDYLLNSSDPEIVGEQLTSNGEQVSWLQYIIGTYLGQNVYDTYYSRETIYFCIETLWNTGWFTGGSGDSRYGFFYGTSRNWLNKANNELEAGGKGSFLGNCIYGIMQQCIFLKNTYSSMGMWGVSDDIEDSTDYDILADYSFGVGLIYNGDTPDYDPKDYETHTYDYEHHADVPEKAPEAPETPAEYVKGKTIIKCYEDYSTSNSSSKVLDSYKWFGRSDTVAIIKIEDEAAGNDYTLTDWFTSSNYCNTDNEEQIRFFGLSYLLF